MRLRIAHAGHASRTFKPLLRVDKCLQSPTPTLQHPHHLRTAAAASWSQQQRPLSCNIARPPVRPALPKPGPLQQSVAAARARHLTQTTSARDRSSHRSTSGLKKRFEDLGALVDAVPGRGVIRLTFASNSPEGHVFNLPTLWFRDACPCSICVSESSGQKRFVTCDIDSCPESESCRILKDGSLEIVWADDFLQGGRHTSLYDTGFIRRLLQHTMLPELYTPARLLWDRATFVRDMDARTISYSEWMGGGLPFAKAFLDLMRWGLVFVQGVPETEAAVVDIASKVGHLQSTFYGLTWDVVSKPNAENAAYTSEFLCLHQDLMYWTPAPRVQLLHCLNNECEGGESLFSDGLRAAAEIQLKNPAHYQLLCTEPVAYQYSKNGNFYRQTRPVIRAQSSAADAPPRDVSWSPPFQGVFPPDHPEGYQAMNRKNCSTLPAWHDAARSFRDSLEAGENMLQYRLQPGDCVVFDNRRILHGRTRFDTASGHRRLRGTYLDTQTLTSTLTRLVKEGLLSVSSLGEPEDEQVQALNMYGHIRGEGSDS